MASAWWQETARDLREIVVNLWAPWRNWSGRDLAGGDASPLAYQIARQQFRTLVQQLPANVLATSVGVLLWAGALWHLAPGPAAVVWLAAGCVFILAMVVFLWQFARAQPPDEDLPRWQAHCGRLHWAMGVTWGCAGFLLPQHAPYVAVGELMVIVGVLGLQAVYRPGISWLTPPCAVLTAAYLIGRGGVLNVVIGIGFLIVVILLARLARTQNILMTQALWLAEERVALLAELDGQRLAAQQANEAKTRFLAMVSHDLRQPMHSIALLAGALRQGARADDPVVGQIGASVQAMDDMLAALLDVSRLDDGTLPMQAAPFAVSDLLYGVELQFAAQARAAGLSLQVQPSAAWVRSDAYQLQRALANLVSNAIRYTASGGVLVRCRVRGQVAWLQVWDTGRGVAREDRQRVFDEFVQVGPACGTKGLGLGLSIVRRVAQGLRHPLVLRSRPSRGSLFALGIPLHAPAGLHASPDAVRSLTTLLKGQLVLLVDDNAVVLRSMQALLGTFGCHVLTAQSVAGAQEAVERSLRTPDLLVCDYRLDPPHTGLDAIQRVREVVGEAVPALLVTAEIDLAREEARQAGIDVLAKPLQTHALIPALARALPPPPGSGVSDPSPKLGS